VQFTGIMGAFQRNIRPVFVGGIIVMILSLGAIFFIPEPSPAPFDDPSAAATPTATPDPDATPTPEPIVRSYAAPPEMVIDPEKRYDAIIRLESGEVRIELLPEEAPGYVNNFVFLARNRFYEGLTFHRVIPGFVAQGGDPTGAGAGGPGYSLEEERNSLRFEAGVLSMAKAGPRVSGSQFFITLGPAPHLNSDFTVFGRVVDGLELLQALTPREPGQPGAPIGDSILAIEIVEREG
jgi:peptidylprolyl isomerase